MNAFKRKIKRTLAGTIALSMVAVPTTAATSSAATYFTPDDTTTYGVIGDFNGWAEDFHMTDDDGDGIYEATIAVPEAGSDYKVRVNADWMYCWGAADENGLTGNSQTNCSFAEEQYGTDVTVYFDTRTGAAGSDTWYVGTEEPSSEVPVIPDDPYPVEPEEPEPYPDSDVDYDAALEIAKAQLGAENLYEYYFFDNSQTQWETVGAYWWTPCENAPWPGQEAIQIEGTDIWAIKYDTDTTSIIFTNMVSDADYSYDNPTARTYDISTYPTDDIQIYIPSTFESRDDGVGTVIRVDGQWSVYTGDPEYIYTDDEGFSFSISEGVATLTGYNGEDTDIVIPSEADGCPVTSIGVFAFCNCSSLTSVTIPNSVTSIEDWAFDGCCSLKSVTIPNSVTSIGSNAFWNCSSLTSITIPNSVTSIGDYAFYDCSSLTSITIPNSVTSIGDGVFCHCSSLTSVTVPNSVTSIGWSAFSGCSSLTSVTIPNSVTEIGYSAFSGCSSLKSVTIPNSVTEIGSNAFWNCSSLTSITIPNSVTEIGSGAFEDCSSLTSVTIPNSVTSIGGSTFSGCSLLTNINVSNGNNNYSSMNGVLFNKEKTELICYPARKSGTYTIPNSVTSIGSWAFYGCSSLTSVTIPNNVTSIESWAFYGCSSLTSVTIPNSVTSIESWAFSGCSLLTSITIPSSITSIEQGAFSGCSSLKSITIPKSVTEIGYSAFSGCSSLTSITIPNSVTSIENWAFDGCSSLKSVTIPNSVTSIGWSAFSGCSSLISITIPNSVTEIGNNAFENCTSLTSVTISNSVTDIGDYALGYYYNDRTEEYELMPNFTIYGTKGSTAEEYANENGIAFKAIIPLANDSTISATSVKVGTAITVNAKATGGTAPYKYYYYCKAPGSNKYVEMKTDVKATSRSTKPTAAGTYYYSVKIVDAKGDYKTKIFTVKADKAETPLANNSTITATSVTAGTAITVNAKATGGTAPYKYYYYCKAPGSDKYVEMKTDVKATSRSTKPTAAGTYYYSVKIVDANGNYKIKIFTVKVNPALTNNSTITATNIKAGTVITVNAKATGGTAPYKYYYYCKAPGSNKYVEMKTDVKATSRSTKPTAVGTYYYSVKIVDANGNYKTKIFTVAVK